MTRKREREAKNLVVAYCLLGFFTVLIMGADTANPLVTLAYALGASAIGGIIANIINAWNNRL